jgi:hypothetical protein
MNDSDNPVSKSYKIVKESLMPMTKKAIEKGPQINVIWMMRRNQNHAFTPKSSKGLYKYQK